MSMKQLSTSGTTTAAGRWSNSAIIRLAVTGWWRHGVVVLLAFISSLVADDLTSLAPVNAPGDAMIEVKLKGGLLWEGRQHNLVLLLNAEGGRWQRVWGYFQSISRNESHGYVVASEIGATTARWDVVMHLPGDLWAKRATFGRFQIIAERSDPQSPWRAVYEARVMTNPVFRGEAEVLDLPFPARRAGYVPIVPGEHPRLLFRKSDLPELRKRLATPFGQAAKRIWEEGRPAWRGLCGWPDSGVDKKPFLHDDPAALGVLYQLTGDRTYADRALPAFLVELGTENYGFLGIGGIWADRLMTLAVAWDCLREAWPDDTNRQIEQKFLQRIELLFYNSGGNIAPTSNWTAPRNSGGGIVALTMAGDPGDPPPALFSLNGGTSRFEMKFTPLRLGIYRSDLPLVIECAPLADVSGPEWTLGKPMSGWVWPGQVTLELRGIQDLLSGLGGAGEAVPVEGTTTTSTVFATGEGPTEIALRFKHLPAEATGPDGLQAGIILGGTGPRTTVVSTLFRVAEDLPIRFSQMLPGTAGWIDHAKLEPDQCYLLKAGTHRLLISAACKDGENPTGRLDPILNLASSEITSLRESLRLFAAHERGDWLAKNRVDFYKDYLMESARMRNYLFSWLGMGEGGFQSESGGYSVGASCDVTRFGLIHWNVMGRLASARGDLAHYIPRHVFSNPVGSQVMTLAGYLHGNQDANLQGLPINGINSPMSESFACSLPFIKPAWQPASLWLWQREAGFDPKVPETALAKADSLIVFCAYPHTVEAQAPSTAAWPLTWSSPLRGYYGFRNGYTASTKDALIQIFAKASNAMGWNHANAGTFTIQALDQPWAISVKTREGYRFQESVVQIPSIINHGGGYGVVRGSTTEPDGSGTLSIDLANVYVPSETAPPLLDKNRMYVPGVAEPSGPISQGRFFAVDYSGKAGVPVVVVIVDRIDGLDGLPRHWQWMLPPHLRDGVAYAEHDFTANAGESTLRVTFAHPAKPVFKKPGECSVTATTRKKDAKKDAAEALDLKIEGSDGEVAGLGSSKKIKEAKKAAATEAHPLLGVGAIGNDHFFAVATIGAGAPPAVEVRGSGLDAVVVIGNRSYRFDGSRVVVGDKP